MLAAASLTESFDQLAKDFEAANPGVTVDTSYGSSATLVQQVDNGAPASVIALAGTAAAAPLDKSMVKDTPDLRDQHASRSPCPQTIPAASRRSPTSRKPTVKVVALRRHRAVRQGRAGDVHQGPHRAPTS